MNEEYKQFETVSDSEVFEVASKLMDEFNEAFEELAFSSNPERISL